MSETDPGPLPTSNMKLSVTIINGSPIYAKSPVLARRFPDIKFKFRGICLCSVIAFKSVKASKFPTLHKK